MGATLRRYFVAGLLVWIPLVITLWVLKLLVDLMDQSLLLLPEAYRSDALFGFHVPGLGILLTVAILLTLVCSLTVLPAMLARWPIAKGQKASLASSA